MNLQVFVTTMHQSDFQKYREMNLQTDAVIANQSDYDAVEETTINAQRVKLVTTAARGTSKNRNTAIAHAYESDFVLFADDDLQLADGYAQRVIEEFEKHPQAEAIKFSLHSLGKSDRTPTAFGKFEKATRRNMASCGVCALVIRQSVLTRSGITFHEGFGPGTENFCGEDTIFLMKLLDKGIRLYRSPVDIGGVSFEESSWFEGYNARYFTTIGAVLAVCYPLLCYLLIVRSAYRFSKRKECALSFRELLICYYRGIRKQKKKG